jgi:hypothetical protein
MTQKPEFRIISRTRLRPDGLSGSLSLNALDHFEAWFLLEVVYFYQRTLDPSGLPACRASGIRFHCKKSIRFCFLLRAGPWLHSNSPG